MGSKSEFARIILRTTVGATMIAHGVKHAKSLEGTAGWFGSIGFSHPDLQAKTSAVVEIGSGAALIAGAATPLAAAAVVGTMGVAARSVHIDNGFWITSEGWEYVMGLSAAAAAAASLGPGKLSVDALLGDTPKKFEGAKGGLLAIVLGLAGAAAQLAVFWRKPTPTS